MNGVSEDLNFRPDVDGKRVLTSNYDDNDAIGWGMERGDDSKISTFFVRINGIFLLSCQM